MFSDVTDWVIQLIERLGYPGVALVVALESVFPPIPSEIVLPFAGFVARDGSALLLGMIAAATVGSLIGAWVLYGIAAWVGPDRLNRFVVRHGRWFRLTADDVARAERWFDRHAVVAVLVGRCVPLVRSLVSIPAGFRRMPFIAFSVYTVIGSLVWNSALVTAGYLLRDNWERIESWMSLVQYAVLAAIVVAVVWLWRKRAAARIASAVSDAGSH